MNLATVYRIPLAIALASLVGLASALVGDGPWDALSWATLGGTVAVGAWYALRRSAAWRSRDSHSNP